MLHHYTISLNKKCSSIVHFHGNQAKIWKKIYLFDHIALMLPSCGHLCIVSRKPFSVL